MKPGSFAGSFLEELSRRRYRAGDDYPKAGKQDRFVDLVAGCITN